MSKKKFRAFICGCIGCGKGNVTLYTLAKPIKVCATCKSIFMKQGQLDVHRGGKLVYNRTNNTLEFIKPEPEPELEPKLVEPKEGEV